MRTVLILITLLSISAVAQENKYSVPERKDTLIPEGYYLESYYPLPFSPVTWTYFGFPDSCSIKMLIRDSLDAVTLDTVFLGILAPGNYKYDSGPFIQKNKKPGEVLIFVIRIEALEERKGYGTVSSRFNAKGKIYWNL